MEGIKQQAPANIFKIEDPPNFWIYEANGQLRKPPTTATLNFDYGDHTSAKHFVVMNNLTGSIIGVHFIKHSGVVIDTTHGLIHFPFLAIQIISNPSEVSAKSQAFFNDDALKISSMTTKKITAFVDHPSEWNITGTLTTLQKLTETVSLLMSHSIPTRFEKK